MTSLHLATGRLPTAVITLSGLCKSYNTPAGPLSALRNVDLSVTAGEFIAVVGKSGSGKSTLANMITGIDTPTAGEVVVTGTPVHRMTQEQLAVWRGRTVGVVFQFFQLLPTLTVVENIMLPMDFLGARPPRERRPRALALLDRFGIASEADKLPADLSGGQQQRAAIARALANDPPVLVADEPTGNLDSRTSDEVMTAFAGLAAEGKTVVMVTHERDLSRFFTRVVELSDGRVVGSSERRAASC